MATTYNNLFLDTRARLKRAESIYTVEEAEKVLEML